MATVTEPAVLDAQKLEQSPPTDRVALTRRVEAAGPATESGLRR
jgi:hypothetical protein